MCNLVNEEKKGRGVGVTRCKHSFKIAEQHFSQDDYSNRMPCSLARKGGGSWWCNRRG
jgi:hypothetical protein